MCILLSRVTRTVNSVQPMRRERAKNEEICFLSDIFFYHIRYFHAEYFYSRFTGQLSVNASMRVL